MDEKALEKLLLRGHSTREIGKILGISQTTVRYWLKKYKLRCAELARKGKRANCSLCGKILDPKRDRYSAKCWSCYSLIRRTRVRRAAFIYKGGKCSACGRGDGPLDAYDFHHVEGDKKFTIAKAHSYSEVRIKEELDKCVLLCAFCHRVDHAVERSDAIMEEVNRSPMKF